MEKIQEILQQDILGTGLEYIWEEVSKIGNIESESTVINDSIDKDTIKKCYNWINLYGKLEEGEYEFILSAYDFSIKIKFTINENGQISYNNPELL